MTAFARGTGDAHRRSRERAVIAAALLLLCALTFGLRIRQFGLIHDDWPLVLDMAQGRVPLGSLDGLRPWLGVPWRLCGLAFGQALMGYYAVLFGLQWQASVLLYLLARPYATAGFSFAFAALSLVYPADASHLWLGTLTQRTAWVLALLALVLADRGHGRPWLLAAAMGLAVASLGLYELQLPLLAFWPLVSRLLGVPWRPRAIVAWGLVPLAYLAWRFVARPLLGGVTVATASFSWDPAWIARRGLLLVPYNLFIDGVGIALRETANHPMVTAVAFAAIGAVAIPSATRWAAGEAPPLRISLIGLLLVGLAVLPILPTTYWLGRTAGTYGARILAFALPGATLLVLALAMRLLRGARIRAVGLSAALALAFAFHWSTAVEAAQNWSVQKELGQRLRDAAPSWPADSFLVVVDMPPNRLSFDTPFGVGRLIRETYGDPTLSGIGICLGRPPGDVLSSAGPALLVQGGAYGRIETKRVAPLRWRATGGLEGVPLAELVESVRSKGAP